VESHLLGACVFVCVLQNCPAASHAQRQHARMHSHHTACAHVQPTHGSLWQQRCLRGARPLLVTSTSAAAQLHQLSGARPSPRCCPAAAGTVAYVLKQAALMAAATGICYGLLLAFFPLDG
jgi:hypothetical protein